MKTSDFNYELPEELIAQNPLSNRVDSKLLVLNKKTGEIEHNQFTNIIEYLNKDDVLVLNDTRVMPARMYGVKKDTLANIEILLLKQIHTDTWECLVKGAKKVKVGTSINFGNKINAICSEVQSEGIRIFKMEYKGLFYEILDELGEMPLPPYIHTRLNEQERYQTVYSKEVGSAAAPTAGLHFNKELLKQIEDKGIIITYITLHVGLGTFRPVNVENVLNHKMHSEYYSLDKETADILNNAKKNKNKIISVGTTSTRTLETVVTKYGCFKESSGWTDIFIYPGYEFKAIDSLITNFHLPKSTLLMLVSAFSSKSIIMNAYQEAILHNYRFFSFGDSMFIK